MSETAPRLAHLLPHWAEHNASHLETYRTWAERARAAGLEACGRALSEAVAAAEAVGDALGKAVEALPPET